VLRLGQGLGLLYGDLKAETVVFGRLHAAGGSLAEVVSSNPAWWTPTAKAEAVVGIALALRFAHGLGLLHGGLNSGNVLFDSGGRIQITDFSPIRRDGGGGGGGNSGLGFRGNRLLTTRVAKHDSGDAEVRSAGRSSRGAR
jgi:serine/threonine protein kinase